ncbi:hypothetical protein PIB30_070071 [Stylosanthes scabra]|uniref:Uncharacterized protein n=1 Tax=Stylosanthes scabra TaxID=79078 RepID=A0ABU6VMU8_9FABA|nr:hypothetical protein [Stylosanthes scabra]
MLKENKEKLADKRSIDIWAAESGTSAPVDPDEVWRQTVSKPDAKNCINGIGGFLASTLRTSIFAPQDTSASVTSVVPAGQEDAVDLREQLHLLNQNIYDITRQLHDSEERQKAMDNELSQRPELRFTDVEALKQQLREELQLIQEAQRQMGVTGEHMCADASSVAGGGSSSAAAAQDPPLPPPPRPAPHEDELEYYVDP